MLSFPLMFCGPNMLYSHVIHIFLENSYFCEWHHFLSNGTYSILIKKLGMISIKLKQTIYFLYFQLIFPSRRDEILVLCCH